MPDIPLPGLFKHTKYSVVMIKGIKEAESW
jgi:hypothetical protein